MGNPGHILLTLARTAIAARLGLDTPEPQIPPDISALLQQPAATFVTLHLHGCLRGCIGTLEAYRPLAEDVQANALAAAFSDPRFPALSRSEYKPLKIEVSLLSAQQPLVFDSEAEALAKLKPGTDGIVLRYKNHRSTFLPQVWEQLPEPAQLMAHLKMKAGLPAEFWSNELSLNRYSVTKYN